LLEGNAVDDSDPSADLTQFLNRTGQPTFDGVKSNPIEITETGPVTIDYGDFLVSTNQGSSWTGWTNWASDSQFMKFLDTESEELYVEFYIRFSPNFYGRNNASNFMSKLFRLGHYSGSGNEFSSSKGDAGPMLYWDYKRDDYGVRNLFHLRGGPPGENYKFNNQYSSGGSNNFVSDLQGIGPNGEDSTLVDLVNGGAMADFGGTAEHAQVFGAGAEWTKVAFYVRMNSDPSATDGILRQYINDSMTINKTDVPWVMPNTNNSMVGWNFFAIGGNDYFQGYPNADLHEDWYAIDDIVVRASLPEGLA
jgi:hypothetical protein